MIERTTNLSALTAAPQILLKRKFPAGEVPAGNFLSVKIPDHRFGFVDQLLVVIIGEEGVGQVDLHPFDLGDLFFLRGVLEGFGLPKKVDDVLGGVPLGGVGDDLPLLPHL